MSISTDTLLENIFGVKTRPVVNRTADNVGVTVIKIATEDHNRVSILICNLSVNALYVSPFPNVAVGTGIYVAPNGGNLVLQWDRDFQTTTHELYAIASGAASVIFVLENLSI